MKLPFHLHLPHLSNHRAKDQEKDDYGMLSSESFRVDDSIELKPASAVNKDQPSVVKEEDLESTVDDSSFAGDDEVEITNPRSRAKSFDEASAGVHGHMRGVQRATSFDHEYASCNASRTSAQSRHQSNHGLPRTRKIVHHTTSLGTDSTHSEKSRSLGGSSHSRNSTAASSVHHRANAKEILERCERRARRRMSNASAEYSEADSKSMASSTHSKDESASRRKHKKSSSSRRKKKHSDKSDDESKSMSESSAHTKSSSSNKHGRKHTSKSSKSSTREKLSSSSNHSTKSAPPARESSNVSETSDSDEGVHIDHMKHGSKNESFVQLDFVPTAES
uniref:Uncharacterized protein n=1 Tax=Entomoneis paludosa TaxID=265537 RepID=A0A7S2YQN7_9STRA|mmetsp:Transcript_5521/g.11718  ORF Transcript_5521/g.11718 Transcript_5521/m.11718 type:complete len:335 (+) Transcript_5521:49-1053(+)